MSKVGVGILSQTSQLTIDTSGALKIAEVASRITDIQQFRNFVESFGFTLKTIVCASYTSSHVSL